MDPQHDSRDVTDMEHECIVGRSGSTETKLGKKHNDRDPTQPRINILLVLVVVFNSAYHKTLSIKGSSVS
jgi:hypothetical protein